MEQFVCLVFHAKRKMCVNFNELESQEWHLPNPAAGSGRIFLVPAEEAAPHPESPFGKSSAAT